MCIRDSVGDVAVPGRQVHDPAKVAAVVNELCEGEPNRYSDRADA